MDFIPIPHLRDRNKLTFVEWLKKKPYSKDYNHYDITREWALNLIELIESKEKLSLKIPHEDFIKKFQHFLYVRSDNDIRQYKYYYK